MGHGLLLRDAWNSLVHSEQHSNESFGRSWEDSHGDNPTRCCNCKSRHLGHAQEVHAAVKAVPKRCTQRSKHMYKCMAKSVTTKVQDSIDPYIKEINQDGTMYFKYIMMPQG
jgi:hypothetical protein